MQVSKVEHVTTFLPGFTLETSTGKMVDPTQRTRWPKQGLVGADCHVPKVTSWPYSTSHSFLGGGASHQAQEPLYSVHQHGVNQTLCLCSVRSHSLMTLSHIFSTGYTFTYYILTVSRNNCNHYSGLNAKHFYLFVIYSHVLSLIMLCFPVRWHLR